LLLDLSFNLKATIAQQLIPSLDGSRRWAGFEVLIGTPLVKDLIRKGQIDQLKNVMRDSGHHGMITFDKCMFRMYKEGKIRDDALRYADSDNDRDDQMDGGMQSHDSRTGGCRGAWRRLLAAKQCPAGPSGIGPVTRGALHEVSRRQGA
jgi:Tfp pilus assembly ATPase PilU